MSRCIDSAADLSCPVLPISLLFKVYAVVHYQMAEEILLGNVLGDSMVNIGAPIKGLNVAVRVLMWSLISHLVPPVFLSL